MLIPLLAGLAIAVAATLSTLLVIVVAGGSDLDDDWPGWVSDRDPWEADAGS